MSDHPVTNTKIAPSGGCTVATLSKLRYAVIYPHTVVRTILATIATTSASSYSLRPVIWAASSWRVAIEFSYGSV